MENSPAFNTLLTWRSSDGKRTLATVLCKVSTLSLSYIGYWTLDDEAKKMLLEGFQSVKEFKLYVAGFDTYNELWPLITSFRNLESLVLGPIQPVKNESRLESFELIEKRPLSSSLQSISLVGAQKPEVIQWLTPCHTLRSFHCFFYNITRDFTPESATAIGQLLSSAGGSLEEFFCTIQVAEPSRNQGIVLDERFHSHIDLTRNTNLRTIKLQIGDSMFQLPFLENLTQGNTGSEPHLQTLVIQNLSELDLDWERLDTLLQHPVFSRLQEIRVHIAATYAFSDISGLSQSLIRNTNVDSEAARNMKEKMAEFRKKLPKTNNRGILKLQQDNEYVFFVTFGFIMAYRTILTLHLDLDRLELSFGMKQGIQLSAIALLSTLGGTLAQWTEQSWASIDPQKELAWVKCYDGTFECGRLQVPLNYSDPDGQSAAIALIRIKSNVSADSADYLGPILFNPGGPGGSGVDLVRSAGQSLATVVGPQFDIVSFDPRGVARSTPKVSWYETRVERQLWSRLPTKELNHSSDSVASYWASSQIVGQLAAERASDVLPYIQTDHTARDMLSITEAYGQEKIQYWGFSWDKIERMIIDGVVDVNDYYTGVRKNNIVDAEKGLQFFFRDCHSAGPELCAFYESSPEAIEQRLNRLYDSVVRAPVPVRTERSYGLVDYERLRGTLFRGLYSSFDTWAALAVGLADLEAGDGTTLYKLTETEPFECSCDPLEHAFDSIGEADITIGCNDGAVVPESLEEAEKHYQNVLEVSRSWGSVWASVRIGCSGWPKVPKTFFRGPVMGNTSHPLLVIGNTADPVTPLEAAKTVSQVFPGSVVLQQDSAG
ncbi:hypothetical protein VNI00_016844 [Paramarasmius palmivorus]|uniref:Uncharacterized protein n=1 Tax=Paramarasmius palmivorus TaxID=297713 RepID=A0AAW0B9R2_9AGAR